MSLLSSIGNFGLPKERSKKKLETLRRSQNHGTRIFSLEQETIKKKSDTKNSNNIHQLIHSLDQRSKAIKDRPNLKNYRAYKTALETLLKQVVHQSFSIEKVTSSDPDLLTKKEFHLIKTVQEEMASLLKMIQSEQKENLALVGQVIKINGLVLNHLI